MMINNQHKKIIQVEKLPPVLHQALLGQLLGDAYIYKSSLFSNSRIEWSFGTKFREYGKYVSMLFENYCSVSLREVNVSSVANGKKHLNYRLKTATFAFFNFYHDMFYKLDAVTMRYKKIVPTNIEEWMSPIVLAHLIMSDGNFHAANKWVRIYTNSFTNAECCKLAQAITDLGIETIVKFERNGKSGNAQHILIIKSSQLLKLQETVFQHMHDSMLYKIGIVSSKQY